MSKYKEKEVSIVKKAIKNEADFMFIPHQKLLDDIINNSNFYVKKLPINAKKALLSKKPISISSSIVLKYYKGTLDKKNSFIFDNGDIEIIREKIDLSTVKF